MILLESVNKRYGHVHAVRNLSLEIRQGEVFGFIGPNGAGKTTTIRMLGGLLIPTSGQIFIDGKDLAKEPEKAKKIIGFIPDRPFLYDKITGMEFLRFMADMYGVDDKIFPDKAHELLKMFSLHEWGNELIASYSHGMKQRIIMCSALLHDPKLLVVDEPMVGLDPRGIRLVKDLIRELAAKGTTIFLSTHTLEVAQDLCHRIGIINRGALIALGNTSDLKKVALVEDGELEAVFLRLTQEQPEAA
ncbi:MAG: ABC transporter ATP-binding protein [Desulfatibacillaceae bacterium]|nr:ABC transporter ATP-binding protein [Desulfatibacillaceae bacterium]